MDYFNELRRKLLHLSSLTLPALCYWLEREQALWLFIPPTLLFVFLDYFRQYSSGFARIASRYFSAIMRPHEQQGRGLGALTGSSYMMLAWCICLYFFDKPEIMTAFCILAVSDTAAALIGKRWGRHKLAGKSVEGCLAFFFTASLCVLGISALFPATPIIFGIWGALICTVVELYSKHMRIDDNLSIPLAYCLWMGLAQ